MTEAPEVRQGISPRRAVFLIARREVVTRVRGKVFVIGTVVALALVAIYVLLQLLVIDRVDTTPTYDVGFSGQAGSLSAPLMAASSSLAFAVHVDDVGSHAQGVAAVRSGSLDALVSGDPSAPVVAVKTDLPDTLRVALDAVVKQDALASELSLGGLDPAAVERRVQGASIHIDKLQRTTTADVQQPIIGFIMAFLLYLFIGIYGSVIGQGVVAEKASRVVEILLSSVRSSQLLLGKVIGIGLVGLLQLAVIVAGALALTLPTHVLRVPGGTAVGAVLAGVMWFVLGFILYSLLIAAAASLVSRVEEVQTATLPVTMFLLLGWLLSYAVALPAISAASGAAVPSGLATFNTVLSLVPPFTPMLMSIRMAAGGVPVWQVLLALALVLATIAAVTWVAARVYDNSVLRFGARIKLSEAFRRAV